MRKTILLTIALLIAGCSTQQSQTPFQKLQNGDADALNAEHSRFDSPKEPAINAQTYYAAGQLAESQGQHAAAIQQYQQALKVDPKNQPSLYRLGVIFTMTRQYPQAIEAWQQYVKATNESAAAYSDLGFCYEVSGDLKQAELTYQQGIKRDGTNQACRVNYGLLLARTNRADQAMQQLSAVLKPAEVHYNLASVYEQIGRKEEARQEYQRALQIDPKFWEAQARMAKLDTNELK